MTPQRNPFLVTLVVIAAAAAVLAFVLAAVSGSTSDLVLAAGASSWAGLLLQVAIFAALGALVAAAITWRPAAGPAETVAPTTSRDIDSTGMTPGEQRFFSES